MPDSLEALFSWLNRTPGSSARPHVTVSYAQSLDGSIAAQPGMPLRLSGPESMRMTHRLRAAHDVVMVGIGTVLADDPQLTVREAEGENPRPVIVDTHLRTPATARVLKAGRPALIAAGGSNGGGHPELEAAGADIRLLPTTRDGLIDLADLVSLLGSLGCRRLMVEGGARLITSFVNASLVDRVIITICPCLVGGLPATRSISRNALGGFPRLIDSRVTVLGEDIVVWGDLESVSA